MKVVVLAAGRGTRMRGVDWPKCLMKIGEQTVLGRLLRQLRSLAVTDVTVVVGFAKELVSAEAIRSYGASVRLVENDNFANDTNILSLSLALPEAPAPFVVIESDCIFSDEAAARIVARQPASSWFTVGSFRPGQVGGILRSGRDGNVQDLRIVPQYQLRYRGYSKLVGVLRVGEAQASDYMRMLKQRARSSAAQYYLQPWIDELGSLPCIETSLGSQAAGSFNTRAEYERLLVESRSFGSRRP